MKLTPDRLRVHQVKARLTHTKPLPLLKLNTGLPGVLLAAQECIACNFEDFDAFTLEFFTLAHASPDPKAIWPRFAVRMLREVCPFNAHCTRVARGYETSWRDDNPKAAFNAAYSAYKSTPYGNSISYALSCAYAASAANTNAAYYADISVSNAFAASISPHPWETMRKIMLEVA